MLEKVVAAFDWLPENLVHDLFWACVNIMKFICEQTGISYEALNIWIFVIIHPLITVLLFIWVLRLRRRLNRLI